MIHEILLLGLASFRATLWLALCREHLDPAKASAVLVRGVSRPRRAIRARDVLFIPGALFALAGGVRFGPIWRFILNLAGDTGGNDILFARSLRSGLLGQAEGRHKARPSHQGSGGGGLALGGPHPPRAAVSLQFAQRAELARASVEADKLLVS